MRRSITVPLVSVALLIGLTACSSETSSGGSTSTIEVGDETVVIDVRTAEEYAAGHLEGAHLLDFNGGELAAAIPSLDPYTEYLIYCRSGNRSAQAIALMEQAGFTDLTNLGSLDHAAGVTKLPITN